MEALTTKVKRFACDRCHTQKLRCPRPAGDSMEEPCVRCKKVGLVCSISAVQKVGRPRRASKTREPTESQSSTALPPNNELAQDTSSTSFDDYGGVAQEVKVRNNAESHTNSANTPANLDFARSAMSPNNELIPDSLTPMEVDDCFNYFDFDVDVSDTIGAFPTCYFPGPSSSVELTPECKYTLASKEN